MQYLINNAGVAKWADLGSLTEEDMLHLFRTNTLGPLMITQEVLREGLLKRSSVVANMTSKVSYCRSTLCVRLTAGLHMAYYSSRKRRASLDSTRYIDM